MVLFLVFCFCARSGLGRLLEIVYAACWSRASFGQEIVFLEPRRFAAGRFAAGRFAAVRFAAATFRRYERRRFAAVKNATEKTLSNKLDSTSK